MSLREPSSLTAYQHTAAIAGAGLGVTAALPVASRITLPSTARALGMTLTRYSGFKTFIVGGVAGLMTGAIVGGVTAALFASAKEWGDWNYVKRTAKQAALLGGIGGQFAGLSIATGIFSGGIIAGASSGKIAKHGLSTVFQKGVFPKVGELVGVARETVFKGKFLKNYAIIGLLGGAARLAYDQYEIHFRGEKKGLKEIGRNVALSVFLGGFCGSLAPASVAYKSKLIGTLSIIISRGFYSVLDIFGDFANDHLIDIREKKGSKNGLITSAVSLGIVNVVGMKLLYPFEKKSALGAVKSLSSTHPINFNVIRSVALKKVFLAGAMILVFDSLMEVLYQARAQKDLKDLDTGRLVGMNLWGFMGLFLFHNILGGISSHGKGVAGIAAKATEYIIKYGLFVGPAMNNLTSRMNNTNWKNSQVGHEIRYFGMMWPAEVIQSILGPTHPISIVADYGFTIGGAMLVNEPFPVYEGVAEMWDDKLDTFVGAIASNEGEEKEWAYDGMTMFLTSKIGDFKVLKWKYLPSEINLQLISEMWKQEKDESKRQAIMDYLTYLKQRGENRIEAEQMIYDKIGR